MKKKAWQQKVRIIEKRKISEKYFTLTLDSARIASQALPGQFVEVKVSGGVSPLLRRPLGIHMVEGRAFKVLFEVAGPGTALLSEKRQEEYLDVIGPLGNGFDYRLGVRSQESGVLVAGGMGVAPLVFLAEKLKECKMQNAKCKTLVLIGAKTKSQILCEKEFKKFGCEVKVATDDGSRGFKGYVSELLLRELSAISYPLSAIYSCGPKPMLREVALISKKQNIQAQISLEEHMACGIGACLGCVVLTKSGFKRVCKDGPVFNAGEMI